MLSTELVSPFWRSDCPPGSLTLTPARCDSASLAVMTEAYSHVGTRQTVAGGACTGPPASSGSARRAADSSSGASRSAISWWPGRSGGSGRPRCRRRPDRSSSRRPGRRTRSRPARRPRRSAALMQSMAAGGARRVRGADDQDGGVRIDRGAQVGQRRQGRGLQLVAGCRRSLRLPWTTMTSGSRGHGALDPLVERTAPAGLQVSAAADPEPVVLPAELFGGQDRIAAQRRCTDALGPGVADERHDGHVDRIADVGGGALGRGGLHRGAPAGGRARPRARRAGRRRVRSRGPTTTGGRRCSRGMGRT